VAGGSNSHVGVRVRVAAGESHADALSAATHAPWLLAVVCGALVAVVGFVGTSVGAPIGTGVPHPAGRRFLSSLDSVSFSCLMLL
jgi:hypothetical protein